MARDKYLEKFIEAQFEELKRRLDVIDAKNDQRDLRVNTMDTDNKAQIGDLKTEIDRLKTTWKVVCIIYTGAIGFLGWVVSQAIQVWDVVHRS